MERLADDSRSLCPTCLTLGRKMIPLREAARSYMMLMADVNCKQTVEDASAITVCWECHRILSKMLKFRHQVIRAERLLSSSLKNEKHISHSSLTRTTKTDFDYEFDDGEEAWQSPLVPLQLVQVEMAPEGCEGAPDAEAARAEVLRAAAGAKTWPCKECEQIFLTKRKMRYHKESVHRREASTCRLCGKVMINAYSLKTHMLTHTALPPLECGICHKTYRGEMRLHRHMMTSHRCAVSAATPYCRQCDASANSDGAVTGRSSCKKCDKRFSAESKVKHSDRNSDRTHYTCDICNKILQSRNTLKNHMNTKHKRAEPRKSKLTQETAHESSRREPSAPDEK